jgi:serine O-acetyltransferase
MQVTAWKQMWSNLQRDRESLRAVLRQHHAAEPSLLWLHPSYQCVLLHRLSSYHFRAGRRTVARLFWHLNLLLTGADIAPSSLIGPGVVILQPSSTQLFGVTGADCVFWGYGGIGGGRSSADIGGGPGLPIIGDRVSFGARAMVLGPVRVGNDCVLGPGVIVVSDVSANSLIEVPDRLQRTARIEVNDAGGAATAE